MTRDDIERVLREALHKLEEQDAYLVAKGVNERSITHRLAVYLEAQLARDAGWSVDCEFNRDGDVPKRVTRLIEAFASDASATDLVQDHRGRTVFPDIIVHVRGDAGPNLLVLEVKREGASEPEIERDREKLRAYVREYQYAHAYFVLLRISGSTIERIDV